MVAQGSWMEGVFIFPTTGDVVIRFQSLGSMEEQTIPKKHITDVEVVWRYSARLLWCRQRKRLRITHHYGIYEFDTDRSVASILYIVVALVN